MCFRPPSADGGVTCPECGEQNEVGAEKCTACGVDLPTIAAPAAPAVPAAPSVPKTPVVPKAPK